MDLDPTLCYAALLARDSRFDGRFFVGVSSTGIYCRPVCRVRTPRPENCQFFAQPAAAEAAGFRPCLRCRPELAPGHPARAPGAGLAQGAAGLIDSGVDDMDAVARRIGVTPRHLRRLFVAEFGLPPVAYAQTRRLLLAKQLLADTSLPLTQVALASGFGSLRRFNALFRSRYALSPGQMRRGGSGDPSEVCLHLAFRAPYAWTAIRDFLGKRAITGVESVAEGRYMRCVRLVEQGQVYRGWVMVQSAVAQDALAVTLSPSLLPVLSPVLARVRHLFDLGCAPLDVAAALGDLALEPGLRLPGAFDGFEMAVRAIIGQQVSVKAARTVAGRFAAAFGEPVATPFADLSRAFPDAARVAGLELGTLVALGLVRQRAGAILALAQAVAAGRLELSPTADLDAALACLGSLPGIGEWTAHYIGMRALGWTDAFPVRDLGVRKAMGEERPAVLMARAEAWRPWRAYAVMQLWTSLERTEA